MAYRVETVGAVGQFVPTSSPHRMGPIVHNQIARPAVFNLKWQMNYLLCFINKQLE